MIGEVTYTYMPDSWNQERFLELGGFTIVFLNYNKKDFIERSVASALNQDFELLEMFFMDDASTDGSGDVMEQIVRKYRGRHKVTVVRNTENQHITGQWNIVSKLATGNWYGMFCGDDIAHRDRATVASQITKENPTIKGFCTNYDAEVASSDLADVVNDRPNCVLIDSGLINVDKIASHGTPIIGATAWWHKSLFKYKLGKAPLDDVHLRWVLQLMYGSNPDPIWLYDGGLKTVSYTVGSGITSKSMATKAEMLSSVNGWLARTRAIKQFAKLQVRTFDAILSYFKNIGKIDNNLVKCAKKEKTVNLIISEGGFKRMTHLFDAIRDGVLSVWVKYTLQELFGLRLAAYFSAKVLHRV